MWVRAVTLIALLAILGYGLIEARPLIAGPSLTIDSPEVGESVPGGFITVSGTARRVNALTLNGSPLLTDGEGRFSRLLILPRGGAILNLMATDRFGRTVRKEVAVYVPN